MISQIGFVLVEAIHLSNTFLIIEFGDRLVNCKQESQVQRIHEVRATHRHETPMIINHCFEIIYKFREVLHPIDNLTVSAIIPLVKSDVLSNLVCNLHDGLFHIRNQLAVQEFFCCLFRARQP